MKLVCDRLDEGVAESRSGDVTDPHRSESSDEHQDKQDDTWSATGGVEDSGRGHDVETGLGQYSSNGKTTDKKHDG